MCSLGLSVGFITKLPPLLRTRQILLQMRPLTGRCRVFFSLETIVLCGIPVKEFAVHKTCFSCSLIQAHKLSWQGAKIYKFYKLQISTMMRWTNKKITKQITNPHNWLVLFYKTVWTIEITIQMQPSSEHSPLKRLIKSLFIHTTIFLKKIESCYPTVFTFHLKKQSLLIIHLSYARFLFLFTWILKTSKPEICPQWFPCSSKE